MVCGEWVRVVVLSMVGLLVVDGGRAVRAEGEAEALEIGSRLEMMIDRYLIAELESAELKLHQIQPAESSPELGQVSGHYGTVLRDGDRFRLYCRGYLVPGAYWRNVGHEGGTLNEITTYAESPDGIHWTLPNLKLYKTQEIDARLLEFAQENKVEPQTEQGNIVLAGEFGPSHNFTPFIDTRPGVPAEERYKGVGGKKYAPHLREEWQSKYGPAGLYGYVSADGLRWRRVQEQPIVPEDWGAFDSQNLAFWSELEGQYVLYFRAFKGRRRVIHRTTSADFLEWSEPVLVVANLPDEELYTNNVQPYFRAPHLYIAPATRYIDGTRPNTMVIFMTSRDGITFDRTFGQEVFQETLAGDRTNYLAWSGGGTQTGPRELSFYGAGQRYTLRLDGFGSVQAGDRPGRMTTKPLRVTGDRLIVNFTTGAEGSVTVELLDEQGEPLPRFTASEAVPLSGDEIEQTVAWTGGDDLSQLAGQTIRIRFLLHDADLFSLRFGGKAR